MVLLVSHQACAVDEHITYTTNEDRKKKEKEMPRTQHSRDALKYSKEDTPFRRT